MTRSERLLSPRPGPLLAASWSLLRQRLWLHLALGAAIVVSLAAVCCGIGMLSAPWFLCELLALQLSLLVGRPVTRSLAWFNAALVMGGAVVLAVLTAWLASLGWAGPSPGVAPELLRGGGATEMALGGSGLAVVGALVVLWAIVPLMYIPLISIDRGSRLGQAILYSARLVLGGGFFAHFVTSLASHGVQIAPPALAAALASLFVEPAAAPLWALGALPLMAVTVPLGQGMVVAAYVHGRDVLEPVEPSRPIPRPLSVLWIVVALTPFASLVISGTSLLRPSPVNEGEAPSGELVGEVLLDGSASRLLRPRDTTLRIRVAPERVVVQASDGGGAGTLPLQGASPVREVRVVRVRDAYALVIATAASTHVAWVDRAGVRLDDDLRRRVFARVPPWALLVMLLAVLATAATFGPAMGQLVSARHSPAPTSTATASSARRRSLARAWALGLALLPLDVVAFGYAVAGALL